MKGSSPSDGNTDQLPFSSQKQELAYTKRIHMREVFIEKAVLEVAVQQMKELKLQYELGIDPTVAGNYNPPSTEEPAKEPYILSEEVGSRLIMKSVEKGDIFLKIVEGSEGIALPKGLGDSRRATCVVIASGNTTCVVHHTDDAWAKLRSSFNDGLSSLILNPGAAVHAFAMLQGNRDPEKEEGFARDLAKLCPKWWPDANSVQQKDRGLCGNLDAPEGVSTSPLLGRDAIDSDMEEMQLPPTQRRTTETRKVESVQHDESDDGSSASGEVSVEEVDAYCRSPPIKRRRPSGDVPVVGGSGSTQGSTPKKRIPTRKGKRLSATPPATLLNNIFSQVHGGGETSSQNTRSESKGSDVDLPDSEDELPMSDDGKFNIGMTDRFLEACADELLRSANLSSSTYYRVQTCVLQQVIHEHGFRLMQAGKSANLLVLGNQCYVHRGILDGLCRGVGNVKKTLCADDIEALGARKAVFLARVEAELWNDKHSSPLNLWHVLTEVYPKLIDWWKEGRCDFTHAHELK
ncbi:unnamed protein product [Choristocarpus tenellus]